MNEYRIDMVDIAMIGGTVNEYLIVAESEDRACQLLAEYLNIEEEREEVGGLWDGAEVKSEEGYHMLSETLTMDDEEYVHYLCSYDV